MICLDNVVLVVWWVKQSQKKKKKKQPWLKMTVLPNTTGFFFFLSPQALLEKSFAAHSLQHIHIWTEMWYTPFVKIQYYLLLLS